MDRAPKDVERAMEHLAPGEPDAGGMPQMLDLVVTLLERWKLLLVAPLLSGALALAATFLIPPTFTSTARVLAPQQKSSGAAILMQQLGSLGGLAGAAVGLKNPAEQYVGILASRTIADALIERFGLKAVYEVERQDEARQALSDRTSLSAGVKDGIIEVGVEDRDPARAAAIANAYVEELDRMLSAATLTEASQRRAFFEEQLRAVQGQLIRAEMALKSSDVSVATLRVEPRAAMEELARMRAAVGVAEMRVNAARGVLADSNPDLQQAQRELQALRAQLARAERGSGRDAGGASEDYLTRYRDFKYQEALFELIAKQYELARLDEAAEGMRAQVIDKAVPADRKSAPRRGLIAVAVSIMCFLALATWLLAREIAASDRSPAAMRRRHRLSAAFGRDGRR